MVFKLTWADQESHGRNAYFGWDGSSHEVPDDKQANNLQNPHGHIDIAVVEVDGRQAAHLGMVEGARVVYTFSFIGL
jgi:hypothetical protein